MHFNKSKYKFRSPDSSAVEYVLWVYVVVSSNLTSGLSPFWHFFGYWEAQCIDPGL